ncbi:MAG: hypothetical protein QHH10_08035 [Peptococcaceae bacterium]|jgi:hypothetical protein|nr:hypothetical protein [Peptococcaceae bacterium]MDH7525249.1 hypothetical protein [Peptococcaceae bacterium]
MFPINRLMEKKILSNINRIVHILIELSHQEESKKKPFLDEAVFLLKEIHPLLLRLVDGKEALMESLIRQLVSQKLPHPSVLKSFGTLQKDLTIIIGRVLSEDQTAPIIKEDTLPAGEACSHDMEGAPPEPVLDENPINDIVDTCTAAPVEDAAETPVAQDLVEPASDEPPPPAETDSGALPAAEQADLTSSQPDQEVQEKKSAGNLHCLIKSMYTNETVIKGFIFYNLSFDYYLPERKTAIMVKKYKRTKNGIHDYLLKKNGIILVEIEPEESNNLHALSQKLPRFS